MKTQLAVNILATDVLLLKQQVLRCPHDTKVIVLYRFHQTIFREHDVGQTSL